MSGSLRSSLGTAVAELSRSVGTIVGIFWVCFVVGVVLLRATDVSLYDVPVPLDALWIACCLVAVVVAGWLADGGYERLGADPDGGWPFVWLAAFFLPLSFLPLRITIGLVASERALLDGLFVLATTLAAGWLAFYGGLERLGLGLEDGSRLIGAVIALGAVPAGVAYLFDVAWLTTTPIGAAIAVGVQFAACWLALR